MILFILSWIQRRQLRELASLRAKTKPGYYSHAGMVPRTYRRFKNGTYD